MSKAQFEHWVHVALIRRGIKQDLDGNWIRCPGMKSAESVADDTLRWLNEYFNRSRERQQTRFNDQLKVQWINSLCQIIGTLDTDGENSPWPFFGLFWIRLHGIFADLRPELAEHLKFVSEVGWDEADPQGASLVTQMHDAIEAFVLVLSEDELIYADYRRQTEAHVTQKSFDVRWSKGRTGTINVIDHRRIPALDKEYSVDKLDAAHDRVFRAYHLNDPAIAVAFARRLRVPAESLLATASSFYGPQ